jgi:hypothetical protein
MVNEKSKKMLEKKKKQIEDNKQHSSLTREDTKESENRSQRQGGGRPQTGHQPEMKKRLASP